MKGVPQPFDHGEMVWRFSGLAVWRFDGSRGRSLGFLGLSWGLSWAVWGRSWGLLGRSWGLLGRFWGLVGRSYLPFPLLAALGEVRARNLHSFFELLKPLFFHLTFLLLFGSVLVPSWAPFLVLLGAQVGPSSAQVAS